MISVLVLTKNEEKMIKTCLESARQLADEIVVLDNFSSDRTVEIARKYTDKIFQKDFEGYDKERNFLAQKANEKWLLYIDADERVTVQLKGEILEAINNKRKVISAFAIPRKNILLGKWQKNGGWWPDNQIRLFRKDKLKSWQGELHERPVFEGELGQLKTPLIHLTHRDIVSMMEKTAQWSETEAKLRLKASHPQISGWRLLRVMLTEFWYRAIKKQGLKEGTEGWIEAIFQSFSIFITYVRLWEVQRKQSLEKTYQEIDKRLAEDKFNDLNN